MLYRIPDHGRPHNALSPPLHDSQVEVQVHALISMVLILNLMPASNEAYTSIKQS